MNSRDKRRRAKAKREQRQAQPVVWTSTPEQVTADTPMVVLVATMSREDFRKRYPDPATVLPSRAK